MTKQEIYDKVCAHLAQQKMKSKVLGLDGPMCAYRGYQGARCAAGVLIRDENYTKSIEGLLVRDEVVTDALMASGVDGEDIYLVSRLQYAHDQNSNAYALRAALTLVAEQLDITPGAEQAITEWS